MALYAACIVDGSVLTVFFDDLNDRADVDLHGKIWNAQMPIVISDEGRRL